MSSIVATKRSDVIHVSKTSVHDHLGLSLAHAFHCWIALALAAPAGPAVAKQTSPTKRGGMGTRRPR